MLIKDFPEGIEDTKMSSKHDLVVDESHDGFQSSVESHHDKNNELNLEMT